MQTLDVATYRGKSIIGERFGRVLVIGFCGVRNERSRWLCQCDCGEIIERSLISIKDGKSSCGCFRKINAAKAISLVKTIHGLSNSRIYRIWTNMMTRCYNRNSDKFKWYGERGISVCEKWQIFYGFLEDMGDSYKEGLTLDRRNNDKNYSKDNCRWVTQKQQCNNQRTNRIITINGEAKTVAEWADIVGLEAKTIYSRLYNGWSGDRAVLEKKHLHGVIPKD